ncbi:hypothetical protein DPMN_144562, partial [Dreissena polymorpha]
YLVPLREIKGTPPVGFEPMTSRSLGVHHIHYATAIFLIGNIIARRAFFTYYIFFVFYYIFVGYFSYILRIIKPVIIGALFLPRLDNSALSSLSLWLAILDSANNQFYAPKLLNES